MNKLLFFSDSACRPCGLLFPIVHKVASEMGLDLEKIEVADNLELAAEYGIESIPQLLVVEDNNVNGRLIGLATENQVIQLLKESEIKTK